MTIDPSTLKSLFLELKDISDARREAILGERCHDLPELRKEIEALLINHDAMKAVNTNASGLGLMGIHPEQIQSTDQIPDRIGAFRVLGILGTGGMGKVYEAQQNNPKRRVALKIIRSGVVSPESVRRFKLESSALAILKHPGIAQIYETGSLDTDDGTDPRPYFAMELVDGEPITQYAERVSLNTKQRLELIAQVNDAIEHAHQRGVIHRDLKPNNILVTDAGQIKILDFGIARIESQDRMMTIHTSAGAIVGTIGYMSPEQLVGDPGLVDTRTDIFSIGILLFELLCGHQPFDVADIPLTEAVLLVTSTDAPRLGSLNKAFRGDIEAIVSKALAQDPGRRYQSAGSMAEDIRRHLADQPIIARLPTLRYQAGKFAKRNKGLVVGFSVAVIALIAGTVLSTLSARAAMEREAEKQVALEESTEIVEFLTNMLGSASPIASGRDVLVVDILAEGVDGLAELDDRPAAQAAIGFAIGVSYLELGDPVQGVILLEKSYRTREQLFGPDDPRTVDAYAEYSRSVHAEHAQTVEETLRIMQQAADNCERVYGQLHIKSLMTKAAVGVGYQDLGQTDKAVRILKEASEGLRETIGQRDPRSLLWTSIYGAIAMRQDPVLAYTVLSPVADLQLEILGLDHPHTLDTLMILAQCIDDPEESVKILEQVVDGRRKLLGPQHPMTLRSVHQLAIAQRHVGRLEEAESTTIELIEQINILFGVADQRTLRTRENLATIQRDQGRLDEAEQTARDSIELAKSNPDLQPRTVAGSHETLAKILAARGDHAGAISEYDISIEIAAQEYTTQHPVIMGFLVRQSESLIALDQTDEAKTLLNQVIAFFNAPDHNPKHPVNIEAVELLQSLK